MELLLIMHLGVLLTLLPFGVPAIAWAYKNRQEPQPGALAKLARMSEPVPAKKCGCSCRKC